MLEFKVSGMRSDACKQRVARAVQISDPTAQVAVDLSTGRMTIKTDAEPELVRNAIEMEGYLVESGARSG
ncbi:heavy-metal-associated domain-containing protein [Amaricoccus macauensis]|uniref:heavy-metal-associated domain-containing protein n=1 Tax=Amaricoccus macauensis TaxID=57001 RepID=UPI003C7A11F8